MMRDADVETGCAILMVVVAAVMMGLLLVPGADEIDARTRRLCARRSERQRDEDRTDERCGLHGLRLTISVRAGQVCEAKMGPLAERSTMPQCGERIHRLDKGTELDARHSSHVF